MKLDHLVILVTDLNRSLAFYDTLMPLLGLDKLREHVYANRDGLQLDLKQAPDTEHSYHRFAPGLNHLGFSTSSKHVLEQVAATMRDSGLQVPAIQQFDSGYAIFFKDPDGMRIEVSTES